MDPRFTHLAELTRLSEDVVRMAIIRVWFACYRAKKPSLSATLVAIASNVADKQTFIESLLLSGLATKTRHGRIRMAGVAGRIGYLLSAEQRGRYGAEKRWEKPDVNSKSYRKPWVPDPTPPPDPAPSPALKDPEEAFVKTSGFHAPVHQSPESKPEAPASPPDRPATGKPGLNGKKLDPRSACEEVLAYMARQRGRGLPLKTTPGRLVRTRALLTEGWQLRDFRVVVWAKTDGPRRWLGDEKMDRFLTFETLFRPANAQKNLEQAIEDLVATKPERARELGYLAAAEPPASESRRKEAQEILLNMATKLREAT